MKYVTIHKSPQESVVSLVGKDFHHVVRVLRHKEGDVLWIRLAGFTQL